MLVSIFVDRSGMIPAYVIFLHAKNIENSDIDLHLELVR